MSPHADRRNRLTHFIVAGDFDRAARFYSDVLGGETTCVVSPRACSSDAVRLNLLVRDQAEASRFVGFLGRATDRSTSSSLPRCIPTRSSVWAWSLGRRSSASTASPVTTERRPKG